MSDIHYLTKEGKKKLQQELEELKGPRREEMAKRLRSAIEMGDLSENADYIKAKEDQGFLEGRIKELEWILSHSEIIDETANRNGKIDIGATVTIKEDGYDGEEVYQLVGSQEADPTNGRISNESPIGMALIGNQVGDVVNVQTPSGSVQFKIVDVA
ncbi:MAG: transcription elongation factor GreA [candidate division Zixibacteria bacterium]|nr:transcription elongation factor GreA [candidate division Zixibacteria bacterium]NIS49162.1 transcription elongation factor GreA [candidate division Zixibacteria bacterium]NIU17260.1 transcription elongation factor GreA [candidate division Zixibacteria bacterium]NIV09383.1 transcription elongation factor GreA [candidate division Zixibacteria bacterium]NIW50278.1 transcription elongation factor GreA [Gammaproteobacteria bacterium]